MTDIIESARRAIARHDSEAPSGVRYLSSALECVGLLRLIVESASAAPLADHGPTPCGPGNYYGYFDAFAGRERILLARITELEADAGRWCALFECGLPVTILGTYCYTKAEADAAIDAARKGVES